MKKRLTMQQACTILDDYAETVGSVLKPWGPASKGMDKYLASGKLPNHMALPDDFPDWPREQQDAHLDFLRRTMLDNVQKKKVADTNLAATKRNLKRIAFDKFLALALAGAILLALLFLLGALGIFSGHVPCTRGTPHGC